MECCLWHDAVYVAGNKDNELLSGRMLLTHMPFMEYAAGLIYQTTINDHISESPVSSTLACLLDADLESLADPYPKFKQNQANIMLENYMAASDAHKVSKFLHDSFLIKKSIYRTEYAKNMFEQRARSNIMKFAEEFPF